jgi:iron complex outermembrane recepter protein
MKLNFTALLAGSSLLALATAATADPIGQTSSATPVLLAAAQQAAAEAAEGEGEIIVTARRREESLQDVPLVVNAVTAETIEKLNIRNFLDITSLVPGLSLTVNANGIGSSSSMRGVNHDVNVSGENGTIQYYMNDAPVASNIVLQAMYDIGQIEVLRGPQGTLRGRSTPSGSITIATRQPDLNEFGGNIQGTASELAENLQAALNIPIIEGKLGLRIAGLTESSSIDNVHSINSTISPERTTESIRVALRAEPLDNLKLGFSYQTLSTDTTAFDQVQSFGLINPSATPSANAPNYGTINPEDRLSVAINPRRVLQDNEFYSWNGELDLFGQSLFYVGSHQVQDFHPITPNDTSNFFPTVKPVQNTQTASSGTSHELRVQNQEPIAGMFDYVAGYFRNEGEAETALTVASILRIFGQIAPGVTFPLAGPFVNNTSIYLPPSVGVEESFFGNLTAHLGESTEISGGLRRISFENSPAGLFISCTRAQFAAGTCNVAAGTNTHQELEETIYNATIRHRLNDNLMIYAATGTSWRPPVRAIGDFTNAPYTPNELAHTQLGPETSTSYEIGVKSDWLDNRLMFNATAFHQEFESYPFRAGGAGVFFININSGGAPERSSFNFISAVPVNVDGVESEIAFSPWENFNLSTTISYSKSEIGQARIACTDALNNATNAVGSDGIQDVVAPTLAQMLASYGAERLLECNGGGQPANFLPEWSGSLRGEYTVPLWADGEGYIRGLATWRGESLTDPTNPFDDVGAYTIFNLYAGVRAADGGWEIGMFAKNVGDTTEITSRDASAVSTSTVDVFLPPPFQNVAPVGTASTTFTSRYGAVGVTAEQEFGVSVRFAFGSR